MGKLSCVLVVCIWSSVLFAQIPNSGFENWTGGEPDGWYTTNAAPVAVVITQSSDARQGLSSLQGVAKAVLSVVVPPVIVVGEESTPGFPVNQRYLSIRGFYKFAPVGSDVFTVTIAFSKNGQAIGGGVKNLPAASAWSLFEVPIIYTNGETPDTCNLSIGVTGGTGGGTVSAGSTFFVDDLNLSLTVSVNKEIDKKNFSLYQNYPNPFNPATKISFSIPSAEFVTLKVFSVTGSEVVTFINGYKQAGEYEVDFNAAGLPDGVYFYRLTAGHISSVKKLVLLK
ncbi:MAG: T9SS type A sorting domain-containing protein [Ignavibacteriales bacterium]|nr:T9SS type A sorting domain-containing protein [Ignavibacteriales bacterium]